MLLFWNQLDSITSFHLNRCELLKLSFVNIPALGDDFGLKRNMMSEKWCNEISHVTKFRERLMSCLNAFWNSYMQPTWFFVIEWHWCYYVDIPTSPFLFSLIAAALVIFNFNICLILYIWFKIFHSERIFFSFLKVVTILISRLSHSLSFLDKISWTWTQ